MTPVLTRFTPVHGTGVHPRPDPGSPVPDSMEGTGNRVGWTGPEHHPERVGEGTGVGEVRRRLGAGSESARRSAACGGCLAGPDRRACGNSGGCSTCREVAP